MLISFGHTSIKVASFDCRVVILNIYFIHFCIAYVQLCNPILSPMNADSGRYTFAPCIWSFHFYIPHERPRPGGLSHNRTIVFSAIDFYRIPESFDGSKDYWIEQYGFNFRHCIYDTAWSIWHTLILITEYLSSPSLSLPHSLII